MRVDGFPDIRDLAAIGDGTLVAVLDKEGTLRWLCLPSIDSASVFGALLDPKRGGHFALRPSIPFDVKRRYCPHTNVLQTDFHTARGVVRVVDSMNVGIHGLLSWREVVKRVEGLSGSVPMEWEVLPRFEYGQRAAEFTVQNELPIAHDAHCSLGVMHWDVGKPRVSKEHVHGTFVARAHQRGLVALATGGVEPLELSPRSHIEARLDGTMRYWERWTAGMNYRGEWQDAIERSALTLAMLVDPGSGAIIAAPTMALPERLGGDRNWDYRYCWTRDMSFTLDALMELEFRETANRSFIWLLRALEKTRPELKPIYRVNRSVLHEQRPLELEGYRGARPVMAGNRAAQQVQLGTYGDLFATATYYVRDGNVIDPHSGEVLAEVANYVCDSWRQPDSGIWELPETQHFTLSKMGAWDALNRAITLAEQGQLPRRDTARWKKELAELRSYIEKHCWSRERNTYVRAAGSRELDAACLLAGRTLYCEGDGQLSGTIDAIRAELGHGPLVYRATGFEKLEGAFFACSFWMVDALARAHRLDEAAQLMDQLVPLANDLGLYSEEIDPKTGGFLGNFPQGLTHLSMINAAYEFQQVRDELERKR